MTNYGILDEIQSGVSHNEEQVKAGSVDVQSESEHDFEGEESENDDVGIEVHQDPDEENDSQTPNHDNFKDEMEGRFTKLLQVSFVHLKISRLKHPSKAECWSRKAVKLFCTQKLPQAGWETAFITQIPQICRKSLQKH